jgi:hypothetical protein
MVSSIDITSGNPGGNTNFLLRARPSLSRGRCSGCCIRRREAAHAPTSCSNIAVVESAGRGPTRRNRRRSNLPASDATANRNRRTHKKNWQASGGMISAFAVPQFGQVIVDSRITDRSREHETEHDQNRAERENARHKSGHNRASACDTGRTRGDAAPTPKQHSAAASEADNGNG